MRKTKKEYLEIAKKILKIPSRSKKDNEQFNYDSRQDTIDHIERVNDIIFDMFYFRIMEHDSSKLKSPEKEIFDIYTPKLKQLKYMSEEYQESLQKMGEALKHHYKHNRHHPEHFENGISDMNLIDLLEMLADWKAASERHTNGNIHESLETNRKRFNMPDHIYNLLKRTIEYMEWKK